MRLALFALVIGLSLPGAGATNIARTSAFATRLTAAPDVDQAVAQPAVTMPVTNLRPTVTGTTVRLDWDAPAEPIVSYVLEAAVAQNAAPIVVFNTGSASPFIVIPNAPIGVYFVRVRGVGPDGIPGPPSNEAIVRVGVQCTFAPNIPGPLSNQVNGNLVTLSWGAPVSGDAPTSYVLEAGSASGLSNLASFDTASLATSFSTPAPTGTYFIRVRGKNACGIGLPSNETVATVACTTPSAPTGLASQISGNQVTLSWGPPSTGGPVTAYLLEAGSGPGMSNIGVFNMGTATSISTTAPNGTYFIRARATNACGTGALSSEATFTVPQGGPNVVNCQESPWSDWQFVSSTACVNEVQMVTERRTRTILVQPQNGGTACGPLEETRTRPQACAGPPPPPIHCQVSPWGDWQPGPWSACENSTRSRTETRTRTITVPPQNGGNACPPLMETRMFTEACVPPPMADVRLVQTEPFGGSGECRMVGNSQNNGVAVCELRGDGSTPSTGLGYQWNIGFVGQSFCSVQGSTTSPNVEIRCTCFPSPMPNFQIEATLTVSNSAGSSSSGPNYYLVTFAT